MRQRDLPLELRITVAQQALPFAHSKAKPDRPIKGTYGRSRTDVNEKIGQRVKVVKVNSDDADADSVTPLDFLLGAMRDADSQPTLRLRVARIVAPYVHRKGRRTKFRSRQAEVDSEVSHYSITIPPSAASSV